tara:strand:+ start:646 stop:942 length:297 start_codon:yes stop_codon:yes gene_type:complete
MKKILWVISIIYFLTACQSTKDALTLKKKESADEFLVEKKSPLVLPPSYGELPIPDDTKNENDTNTTVSLNDDELKINELIINSEPTTLEKSVVEKMK